MRKFMFAATLALVAACAGGKSTRASADPLTATGTTSAKGAVEGFMAAVKAQDLQAMGAIWGNAKGPAREQLPREETEKRLIVMQCTMQHDSWGFAESQPHLSVGGQEFTIDVRQKSRRARTTVKTIQGPGSRWYVMDVDLRPMSEFCR